MRRRLYRDIRLGVRLLRHADGAGSKLTLLLFFLLRLFSRVTHLGPPHLELSINLAGLKFRFWPAGGILSPFEEIFCERMYELDSRFVPREGDTVFDVGAHIGFYTLRQASRIGPKGRLYAFEPHPELFRYLKLNCSENGFPWVSVIGNAVTATSGPTVLALLPDITGAGSLMAHGRVKGGPVSVEVDGICLDDFVEHSEIERIDIIKIDVEGAELDVLSGGLNGALPITQKFILEYHSLKEKQEVAKILERYGFSPVLETGGQPGMLYYARIE